MNTPKVAIVIVTWNRLSDVVSLIESLSKLNYDNFETVVVDNASSDGTAEELKHRFPSITLLVNDTNLGGTGGFNRGIDHVLKKIDCKYTEILP